MVFATLDGRSKGLDRRMSRVIIQVHVKGSRNWVLDLIY